MRELHPDETKKQKDSFIHIHNKIRHEYRLDANSIKNIDVKFIAISMIEKVWDRQVFVSPERIHQGGYD